MVTLNSLVWNGLQLGFRTLLRIWSCIMYTAALSLCSISNIWTDAASEIREKTLLHKSLLS